MLILNDRETDLVLNALSVTENMYIRQAKQAQASIDRLPEESESEAGYLTGRMHEFEHMAHRLREVGRSIRAGLTMTGEEMAHVRSALDYASSRQRPGSAPYRETTDAIHSLTAEMEHWDHMLGSDQRLKDNQSIRDLLALLRQPGKEKQAADLSELVVTISSLEEQLDQAYAGLRKFKKNFAAVRKNVPSREAVRADSTIKRVEFALGIARTTLRHFRARLILTAENLVVRARHTGTVALDSVADAMRLRPAMAEMESGLHHAAGQIAKGTERLESFSKELHTAAAHFKNAGRALNGTDRDIEVAAPFYFPLHRMHRNIEQMEQTVGHAVTRLDALHEAAARPERPAAEEPDESAPAQPQPETDNTRENAGQTQPETDNTRENAGQTPKGNGWMNLTDAEQKMVLGGLALLVADYTEQANQMRKRPEMVATYSDLAKDASQTAEKVRRGEDVARYEFHAISRGLEDYQAQLLANGKQQEYRQCEQLISRVRTTYTRLVEEARKSVRESLKRPPQKEAGAKEARPAPVKTKAAKEAPVL